MLLLGLLFIDTVHTIYRILLWVLPLLLNWASRQRILVMSF